MLLFYSGELRGFEKRGDNICGRAESTGRGLLFNLHSLAALVPSQTLHQRDGCPRIVNLGQARVDLFFDKKKLGGGRVGGGIR